jgi:hypothetical protein
MTIGNWALEECAHLKQVTRPSEPGPDTKLVSGSIKAGECNAHHATLGDSNPKALFP